jgi:hypothetical protein
VYTEMIVLAKMNGRVTISPLDLFSGALFCPFYYVPGLLTLRWCSGFMVFVSAPTPRTPLPLGDLFVYFQY